MTLLLIVLLPLLGALVPLMASSLPRGRLAWLTAVAPALALGIAVFHLGDVFAGQIAQFHLPWITELGLDLALRFDGLSALFVLLILGIGLLIILYSRYYLSSEDSLARLYSFLMLFMTAMLGIVMADNLLLMWVFWELTSLSSFLLIGYWYQLSEARKGARMALTVTGAGGLALLAGILVIGHIVGSYQFDDVLAAADQIRSHELYPVALVLRAAGRLHQVRAVPVPVLAAPRDVGADTGVRLPALRHHGQGRGLPAGAHAPGVSRGLISGSTSSASRALPPCYMAPGSP